MAKTVRIEPGDAQPLLQSPERANDVAAVVRPVMPGAEQRTRGPHLAQLPQDGLCLLGEVDAAFFPLAGVFVFGERNTALVPIDHVRSDLSGLRVGAAASLLQEPQKEPEGF